MLKFSLVGIMAVALFATLLMSPASPRFGHEDGGQDFVDADALARADPAAGPAFRELDAQLAVAQLRIGLRQEVALDLAAGRLTLDQAADQFKEMNTAHPAALTVLAHQFPGAGEEELVCRQVLGFVRALAYSEPAAKNALPALTAEVARRFPPPTLDRERAG